jgi:hypothetical protein
VVSGKRLFPYAYRPKPLACFEEFGLDRVLGGLGALHTQKDAGSGRSSEFTFPLVEGRRRAVDRLAELRDGSIGSFALGDTFGPNLGGFRGR